MTSLMNVRRWCALWNRQQHTLAPSGWAAAQRDRCPIKRANACGHGSTVRHVSGLGGRMAYLEQLRAEEQPCRALPQTLTAILQAE